MAWIRRVRTASGATAVQIAESVNGQRQIVHHLGSAHNETELALLIEQAHTLLADDRQGILDLGLTPQRAKPALVAPPSNTLLPDEPVKDKQLVSTPRVVRSSSAVLYDALAGIYAQLGFDSVADEVFRDLVIARVVEPTSLSDTGRVLTELGKTPVSLSTRKRCLNRVKAEDYRGTIAQACFTHAVSQGDISLVLYDVTTLYFEAEKEDDLRKVGYSKERRVDPQIIVGLLVDREGFPLEIGCFEGNKAETHTIIPIVQQFQARHGLADMVVVADAGMLSAANLSELDAAGLRFIVGSRMTKAPLDLADYFAAHGQDPPDGQIVDTLTTRRGASTHVSGQAVWDHEAAPKKWRAVWQFRVKRAARDLRTLDQQRERALRIIDGQVRPKNARFVTARGGRKVFDEDSFHRARRLAGWKGYVTNIDPVVMPAGEVVGCYHDLWHVEQSFRMSKTDLRARPIFARTRDAIEAHLTIVFTALAVARYAQNRAGVSVRKLVQVLRPLRSAVVSVNGQEVTLPPEVPAGEQEILKRLGWEG